MHRLLIGAIGGAIVVDATVLAIFGRRAIAHMKQKHCHTAVRSRLRVYKHVLLNYAMLSIIVLNVHNSRLRTAIPRPGWPMRLLLAASIASMCFYVAHRTLHTKLLFKRVHHVHHRFKKCYTCTSALYCHPVELLIGNVLPLVLPALVVHLSQREFVLFTAVAFISAITSHIPYKSFHSLHHTQGSCNFGLSTGICDWLGGTLHQK